MRERAEEFSPAAYIEKPFDSEDLLRTISTALGHESSEQNAPVLATGY